MKNYKHLNRIEIEKFNFIIKEQQVELESRLKQDWYSSKSLDEGKHNKLQ